MPQLIYFIVNARIGEKNILRLRNAIQLHLLHIPYEIHVTEYGGHATLLAQEAVAKKIQTVVAVGGDGTVNEVIQALVNTNISLGIVPTGSGNGLARHCSIPIHLEDAVALLYSGHAVPIDLGKANEIYFISNAGVGFDAVVCNTIKLAKSRGLKMYVKQVIANYFSYQADTYTIQIDGQKITQKAFFLNVANGKEFGYGFQIAPNATLQDGLLDLILVKKINPFLGLKFVWDGWRKKLNHNTNCIHHRGTLIRIQGNALHYFQTDGDAHTCDGECLIQVYPKALQIIVPHTIHKL